MLIILSLNDFGFYNLRWILELGRKGFPRKKRLYHIECPEFPDIASKAESILKIIALEKIRKR